MKRFLSSKILILLSLFLPFVGCSKAERENKAAAKANKLFEEDRLEQARIEYLNLQRYNPTNQLVFRRLGEIYYRQADLRRAFAYLAKSKELNPDDIEVQRMLARTFLAAGRRKEAGSQARAILAKQSDYPDAILLLPETILSVVDIQKVKTELETLKGKIGDQPAIQVALANLMIMEGKPNLAEPMLQKVVTNAPTFGPAYLSQAGLFVGRGDTNNAVRAFELAVQHSKYEKHPIQMIWADYKYRLRDFPEAKTITEKVLAVNPQFLTAQIMSAKIAFREKEFEKASTLVKGILERDPSHFDAQLLKAEMLIAKNDFPKALEVFEVMLKEYPENSQLHLQAAKAYRADNQNGKAISLLTQAINLTPDYPEATLILAELNLQRGEVAPVVTSLSSLISKQPNLPQAYILLGQAYERRKTPADALQVYSKFTQLYPKESVGLYLSGALHKRVNNLTQARESFQQALQINPDSLSVISQMIDLDLLEGKTNAALTRAEDAMAKYPRLAIPHLFRAHIYEKQSNPKEAEAAYLKAIEIQPESTDPYLRLANFYVKANKQEEALKSFVQLTSKNTNSVGAWMQLGTIQEKLGKNQEALASYERALALDPKFGPALNNLAFFHAEHFNSLDKGLEYAKRAREYLPDNPNVADTFGWILYRRGDYPRALQLLKESAASFEGNPEAQDTLGEVLYHVGMTQYALAQEEEAKQTLTRALKTMEPTKYKAEAQSKLEFLNLNIPEGEAGIKVLESHLKENSKDVVAWSRHAEAMEKAGKVDDAVKSLETALGISPSAMPPLINLARITIDKLADEEKGTTLLKRIRAISPENPDATHLAGKIAYRKNDYSHAYDYFNTSVRALPGNPDLLYDLALSQFALGQLAQAKETLVKLLALKADDSKSADGKDLLVLISLYQKIVDPSETRNTAQKILAKDPQNLPALMVIGKSYEAENNKVSALQTYEKLLQKNSAYPPALKAMALNYAGQDDKKAIEWAEKARSIMRADSELAGVIGLASYRLGDFKRAVPFLTEAINQKAENAQILYCLGLAQYQLKRTAEARNYLTQALALDAKNDMASQARKVLAQLK